MNANLVSLQLHKRRIRMPGMLVKQLSLIHI